MKKTAHFGIKKLWNGAEIFFVALSHIQMVYLKKKLAKIGQFYPRHWRKESSGRYMGLPPPTMHRPNSEVLMVPVPMSTALEKIAQIYKSVIFTAFASL